MCERALSALRGNGLLNQTVGVNYLARKWPASFEASGAWPLSALRKSFLDGSLTRLPDPDEALRRILPEHVLEGEFGLAFGSGGKEGEYKRVCFRERVAAEDIDFAGDVFLLTREKASALKASASGRDSRPPSPFAEAAAGAEEREASGATGEGREGYMSGLTR